MSSPASAISVQLTVAGGGVTGEKAERVAVDPALALAVDGGALGVGEARIHRESGGLAFARQLDRALGRDVPGMIEIEIGNLARQRLGLHESRVRILGRVAGD